MKTFKEITAILLSVSMIASSMVLAGCNDDKNNNGEETSQKESSLNISKPEFTQESSEKIEDIKAISAKPELTNEQLGSIDNFIAQYKKVPSIVLNEEKIDAAAIAKDKKISLIVDNSNYVFTSFVKDQFIQAGRAVGLDPIITDDSDGTVNFYNTALEKLRKEKGMNLALMYGDINKDPLAQNIELAQATGIKILSGGYVGRDMTDHYVDYTIPIDYNLAGKLLADCAISNNKGKVNALALNNSDSMVSTSIYKGFSDEFVTYVSEGYCTVLSGSSIEIGNGLATKIKQALEKDRNLNYIVVLDENMINDALSAVEQSGKRINIIATGGSSSAFLAAENGKIDTLVAQSYEWTAYAMMDYVLRVLGDKKLPEIQSVPVRVVNGDTIANEMEKTEYEDIEGFYEICFGANFITGYRKMWGLEVKEESKSEDES